MYIESNVRVRKKVGRFVPLNRIVVVFSDFFCLVHMCGVGVRGLFRRLITLIFLASLLYRPALHLKCFLSSFLILRSGNVYKSGNGNGQEKRFREGALERKADFPWS